MDISRTAQPQLILSGNCRAAWRAEPAAGRRGRLWNMDAPLEVRLAAARVGSIHVDRNGLVRFAFERCSACRASPAVKLTLAVRTYRCAACGYTADRDVNAAKNVLAVGRALDRPGGAPPARRKEEEERGAGDKAGHRVAAQNDIRGLAA